MKEYGIIPLYNRKDDDDKYHKPFAVKRLWLWKLNPWRMIVLTIGICLLGYGTYLVLTSGPGEVSTQPKDNVDKKLPVINKPVGKVEEPVVKVPSNPTQQKSSDNTQLKKDAEKQKQVVDAFKHGWKGYEQFAFGFDTLHPLTKKGSNWFQLGLTMVDAIDTAHLMGLDDVVTRTFDYIKGYLAFTHDGKSNLFELTIRILGSFLTMHDLSDKPEQKALYLDRAIVLADTLLKCFDNVKVPKTSFNFKNHEAYAEPEGASTAEAATLQLEWRFLSVLTGDLKYWEAVENVMKVIKGSDEKYDGLVPIYINNFNGEFSSKNIRLGSRGDSYYEYLWKQYVQFGKEESVYKEMWEEALDGIMSHLARKSIPSGLTFVGELQSGKENSLSPKMDHLVCFLPGTIALYISDGKILKKEDYNKFSAKTRKQFDFAQELLYTCYRMYKDMATGLAPEIAYFNLREDEKQDIIVHPTDAHNLLRPETVESLFYFYRATGNETYRSWAYEIFQSFEKHTKVENGYTSLDDVTRVPPPQRDNMESFFMAETLKYLYLIFDTETRVPLDKYVFNTEAHPLPIMKLDSDFKRKLEAAGLGFFPQTPSIRNPKLLSPQQKHGDIVKPIPKDSFNRQ